MAHPSGWASVMRGEGAGAEVPAARLLPAGTRNLCEIDARLTTRICRQVAGACWSQHVALQLREYLRHLAKEIVAVTAGEGTQILAVPPLSPVIAGGSPRWQRRHLGREGRIEEERGREPAAAAEVTDPVRRRAVPAPGEPLKHVTDIADERSRDRRGVDPALRRG